jgi:hypothetical protein
VSKLVLAVLVAAIGCLAAGLAAATEVVVLRGGARFELQSPPVRQGNNVLMTRTDGTLFSAPASEIDWKATAEARSASKRPAAAPAFAAPATTPAEAARASSERGKARVKITDEDVGHVTDTSSPADARKDITSRSSTAKLEIADYNQERSGANLLVQGTLRNVGALSALRTRMNVTAVDETGSPINSGEATMSNGTVEAGHSVAFTASIAVGDRIANSVRFTPQWVPEPAPAAAPSSAASPARPAPAAGSPESGMAAPAASNPAPAPAPTPYGRGLFYAAPPPPAAMSPSADGKTGYVPGAARPEDQPKPPQ